MANKKFSEFVLKTSTSDVSHIVGYNGAENVQITPANFVTGGGTGVFLPLAGGTMVGNTIHNDNVKSIFGSPGNDLQIYHDSSNSYIQDVGQGGLVISASDLYLRNPAGADYITSSSGGTTKLFFDGSEKLATTTTGISVTGSAVATTAVVDNITAKTANLNFKTNGGLTIAQFLPSKDVSFFGNSTFAGSATFGGSASFNGSVSCTSDIFTAQNKGIFFNGISDFSSGISGINSGTEVRIFAGGSEKMRLDSSGNLGIGTSTVRAKLDVAGNVVINHTTGVQQTKLNVEGSEMPATSDPASVEDLVTLYRYGSNTVWAGGASLALGRYSTGGSSNPKSRLDFKLKDAVGNGPLPEITVMTMQSNGFVGVGTVTPSATIDVRNDVAGNYAYFGGSTDGGARGLIFSSADNGAFLGAVHNINASSGSGILTFSTGGVEKMRLTSSGDLLVGLTSSFSLATHDPNVMTNQSFGVYNGVYKSTIGIDRIHFDSPNYFVLNGSAVGVKLVNGATAWTAQSDEKLKENIKPLENVLDKIKDYRCVEYNLKAEKTDKKIGFIAQDWEQDFDAIVDKDADGILSMKYTETIPVLLKAIQELSAKLEALECQCEKK